MSVDVIPQTINKQEEPNRMTYTGYYLDSCKGSAHKMDYWLERLHLNATIDWNDGNQVKYIFNQVKYIFNLVKYMSTIMLT